MTGSGKTGLGVVLIEEVLRCRRAGHRHRPEGRPHQPLPDCSPTSRRPTSGRGSTSRRRRTPASRPTSSPPQQATLWTDGPRSMGLARWRHRERCVAATDVTIYTPGSHVGRAGEPRRLARRCRPTWTTPRPSPTRSAATCRACSASSASTPTRCRAASTSCCPTSIHHAWEQGQSLDLPTLVGQVASSADPQARRVRTRPVLPRRRTAWRWP